MPASWPTSVVIFTSKVDITDVNFAAHINALQDEVVAIENSLGLGVKGAEASVDARLDALDTGKAATVHTHVVADITDLTTTTSLTSYLLKSLGTAKGTLIGFSGASTPGTLAASTDLRVLELDAASTLGFRWGTKPIKAAVGTTKGDILAFDGTDWLRLPVGATAGFALVVDAAEATGIKWAAVTPDDVMGFQFPGALIASTGRGRFRFPWAATVLGVAATVDTAPTGASVKVDVNKIVAPGSGSRVTIFTTQGNRPTIATSAFDSGEMTPDVTAFAAGDHMTIDIDQIGSTIAGSDLTVWVRFKKA